MKAGMLMSEFPPALSSADGGYECGYEEKAGLLRPCKWLKTLMSRAGLEPATHWLKASCSTN